MRSVACGQFLVRGDPAPGNYHLPGAQREGLAVIDVLKRVQDAWGKNVKLEVTVRLGALASQNAAELRDVLEKVRNLGPVTHSAEPCDPLELLALLVNEAFDVVHYAGHGIFDVQQRRMGWVFDENCTLSAAEIFRVRQVPRLVFANACLSAVTINLDHKPGQQQRQQVGLAEAFFGRGIENYIGAGWEVSDALAVPIAVWFYSQALGLKSPAGDEVVTTAPPATLGDALAAARRDILHQGSTWGAYQHYGQANAKLLAFSNKR